MSKLREKLLEIPELKADEAITTASKRLRSSFQPNSFFNDFLTELNLSDEEPLVDKVLNVVQAHPLESDCSDGEAIKIAVKERVDLLMNMAISEGLIKKGKVVEYVKLIG